MIKYNKLVRDNIPQIIKESGKECNIHILSNDQFKIELKKKLVEEANELLHAKNYEESIEELADIYEVLETILIEEKYDLLDIKKKRIQKNMSKGSFEEKIFLEYVK